MKGKRLTGQEVGVVITFLPNKKIGAMATTADEGDDREPTAEEEPWDMENHPLGDFFEKWEGRSGLYFLSPYFIEQQPDERYPVKVGMSRHRSGRSDDPDARRRGPYGGLGRRMDSYLLCYPTGFYVYAILQCDRQYVYRMEKFFHQYFRGKNFHSQEQHSHREEWFGLTRDDIFSTINAYRRAHPSDIQTFLVFPPPGLPQFVDTNGRLAAHLKKSLPFDQKLMLENFMSPGRVPGTLPRKKKGRLASNEGEVGEVPAFDLPTDDSENSEL